MNQQFRTIMIPASDGWTASNLQSASKPVISHKNNASQQRLDSQQFAVSQRWLDSQQFCNFNQKGEQSMLPHEEPYLFRNTLQKLKYCVDELEDVERSDLQWASPEEEKASQKIRLWCQRYIDAYDCLPGTKPDDE
jgi:hypothetical protein